MTALELKEGLLKTGTAEKKLAALDGLSRHASATDACAKLEEVGMGTITMDKARHLAAGRDIDALMGTPPPNSAESKEKRLAMEIAKALRENVVPQMAEKTADKSPGKLVRPTA